MRLIIVQRALDQNSGIDTIPHDIDKKAFTLRPREPTKELASDKIKIKPSNSIERINDTLHNHALESYLPDGETVKSAIKHAIASRSTLLSPAPNKHSRASNQSITLSNLSPKANFLPGLHMKTHFNGATALMMQYDKSSLYYEPDELNQ